MEVDISRFISNEMKSVSLNCATSAKASLIFPGLIMGLLRAKGIKIPTSVDEEIQHPIDDTFISSLVKTEERTSNYQGSFDDEKTTGAGSFDLSGFQSFMESNSGIISMFETRTSTSCTRMRPLTGATCGFIRLCIMLTCI